MLIDADDDCPAKLGLRLLEWANALDSRVDVASGVVDWEFETWFIASAGSLTRLIDIKANEKIPDDPEGRSLGGLGGGSASPPKGVKSRGTVDQPKMTSALDLEVMPRSFALIRQARS